MNPCIRCGGSCQPFTLGESDDHFGAVAFVCSTCGLSVSIPVKDCVDCSKLEVAMLWHLMNQPVSKLPVRPNVPSEN